MRYRKTLPFIVLILSMALAGCDAFGEKGNGALTASGTIAVQDVAVAPEVGGRVEQVYVNEGDAVEQGDVLFELGDALLQSQRSQAIAAVDAASATLDYALAQQRAAQLQVDMALQGARMQEMEARSMAWRVSPEPEIDTPIWYFQKDERLNAFQAELDSAEENLDRQQEDLAHELEDVANQDFVSIEQDLAEAQTEFEIASLTLEQARRATDNAPLLDAAQEAYDGALAELKSAQLAYDRILSTSAAEHVLEARAEVAVAWARLKNTQDQLNLLQSGDESLQVASATAALDLADSGVAQARANLAQAEAALETLEIQLEKSTVRAAIDGAILSRNIEVGELVAAGVKAITIGQLDEVMLTVYVPEDHYGRIGLGQEVSITADSFENMFFIGHVVHIADQAEFTPRNVQTVEGRKTTVYAVKIVVPNQDHRLKPGMPVDVAFMSE